MFNLNEVNEETKNRVYNNVKNAGSKLYTAQVVSNSIIDSVLDTLTDEEIQLLASLPKSKLKVKVGFSFFNIFKF